MDQSDLAVSLRIPFEIGQRKVAGIQLRNVTRLDLEFCQSPMIKSRNTPLDINEARAKVFAHLISMLIQLKYLLVEKIEWLYHIIQYASDGLKQNALRSVRCADFESLQTSESIAEHTNVFEQDLSQLIERLKEFAFLDIHGKIDPEKLESYRTMAEACFPQSRIEIGLTRFRLWM
ncbi:unnamed protein product [Rotaria magnacalcarata]|uniref:Uncharacterized protein n=1 Tax=Rotaria magnacalcarata TaxID=392030 RepID=A0A8S2TN99_9BILA|nr:unnamed protein product [Rotaria magnacalcarata]